MTRPRQPDPIYDPVGGRRGYLVEQARQQLGPQMFNESQASAHRAAALVRQAAIDPNAPDVVALRDALQQIDARQRRQDLKAASAAMSDARDWTADANTGIDVQELQERRGVTDYQHRLPSHAEVHAQREQYQDIHDALHQATEQANQRADELAEANKAREDDMSVTDYPNVAATGSAAWATQQLQQQGYSEANARDAVNKYLDEVEQRSKVPAGYLGMDQHDIAEARDRYDAQLTEDALARETAARTDSSDSTGEMPPPRMSESLDDPSPFQAGLTADDNHELRRTHADEQRAAADAFTGQEPPDDPWADTDSRDRTKEDDMADKDGLDDSQKQPGNAADRDSSNLPIGPAGDPDPYVYDTDYETHEEAMARLGLDGGSPKQQRLIDEANARTADEANSRYDAITRDGGDPGFGRLEGRTDSSGIGATPGQGWDQGGKARDDAADADAASASAALALAQAQQRGRDDDSNSDDGGRSRSTSDEAVAVAE